MWITIGIIVASLAWFAWEIRHAEFIDDNDPLGFSDSPLDDGVRPATDPREPR